jgi:hypothetical protein
MRRNKVNLQTNEYRESEFFFIKIKNVFPGNPCSAFYE